MQRVTNASAKDVLSPALVQRLQTALGDLCEGGCRLYIHASKPQRIRRSGVLTDEDKADILSRSSDEAVQHIADHYLKSASYIHRLIADAKEEGT